MSKWGTFLSILEQVGPVVLAANPATAAVAPLVVHAIREAHALPGSGADKKEHAMKIVTDGVAVAHLNGVRGFEDPATVLEAVDEGIDTVVGAVKVVEGAKKAV